MPDAVPSLLEAAARAARERRHGEAASLYRDALSHRPGHLEAEIGLARALFCLEQWEAAWRAFDVRLRLMASPPMATRRGPDGTAQPVARWSGGPVPKRLLVLDEQGLGDTIQFVRFLPRLAEGGRRITFVTHSRLHSLLRPLLPKVVLCPMEQPGQVPGVDGWVPLLSVPGALGLGGDELAASSPYLLADPVRVARWRSRLPRGFRIGLAWQGNPAAPVDKGRSAPLAAFAPLAALPGVALVSLQAGTGSEQIDTVPFASRLFRPGLDAETGADAFIETAAIMASLDLVVTVDTAIAHLAGALGVPVAILLKTPDADWRWLDRPSDTVWYESARLYRQDRPGDWWEVLCRVADDVAGGTHGPATPNVPVSVGELLDKISILEIKADRIRDRAKLDCVGMELQRLTAVSRRLGIDDEALAPLRRELGVINSTLWTIEEEIRRCEAEGDFGPRFIDLARRVYQWNDRRAEVKAAINAISGSVLREVKSYA